MSPTLSPLLASFTLASLAMATAGESADAIQSKMEAIRERRRFPALAAIVMIDGKIQSLVATGVRKEGASAKVTTDDCWQIGSDTKSMTATLAAMSVEKGEVKWRTTVAEVFPELRDRMAPAWREATLEQLLTNRGGAPGNAPRDLWAEAWKKVGAPMEQRMAFITDLVSRPPEAPPGSRFIYSNQGYAIAGGMLERIAKKPWEDLMRERLFIPLGMTSAGFGAPGTLGKIDQPWGHSGPDRKPNEPGPEADNPPAIAPAAAVNCSLTDLARYAGMHAAGERTGAIILKPESFVKLHTPPPGGDYAFGWIVTRRAWAGGTALSHSGSNTMFFVNIWLAPAKNAVLIAATNSAGEDAAAGTNDAIDALIQQFLPE